MNANIQCGRDMQCTYVVLVLFATFRKPQLSEHVLEGLVFVGTSAYSPVNSLDYLKSIQLKIAAKYAASSTIYPWQKASHFVSIIDICKKVGSGALCTTYFSSP